MLQPRQKRRMLGELLISEGLITQAQLDQALVEQKRQGIRLGQMLDRLGLVSEKDIISVIGKQMGIPSMPLDQPKVDSEVLKLVPEETAKQYQAVPVSRTERSVMIALVDPLNVFALDDLARLTGLEVQPVISTAADIGGAIDRWYRQSEPAEPAASGYVPPMERRAAERRTAGQDRLGTPSQQFEPQYEAQLPGASPEKKAESGRSSDADDMGSVIRLVDMIIAQAVRDGASDIHIEPDTECLKVRFRADGMLREVMKVPLDQQPAVTSRVKIMASVDIAEKRVPQDGRIQVNLGSKILDLRASTLPTIYGEKIVLRILDKSAALLDLDRLGFSAEALKWMKAVVARPHGLLLVTGPTGSGKSTTLYAALQAINFQEKNVVTVEDPVEYQMRGINQVQVNVKAGLTFAAGLRSIVRQDPDVIMVGEVRDPETAGLAIQAALTGHLVITTLHTNDAPGAVTRLMDMGIEPFLIASSLLGVLAQRLVRRICQQCRQNYAPTPEIVAQLGLSQNGEITLVRGAGCQSCRGVGYKGRMAIYEHMVVTDKVRAQIISRVPSTVIRADLIKDGFVGLREDGIAKAVMGQTTVEEVLRVSQAVDA